MAKGASLSGGIGLRARTVSNGPRGSNVGISLARHTPGVPFRTSIVRTRVTPKASVPTMNARSEQHTHTFARITPVFLIWGCMSVKMRAGSALATTQCQACSLQAVKRRYTRPDKVREMRPEVQHLNFVLVKEEALARALCNALYRARNALYSVRNILAIAVRWKVCR
jgi:hypothetical protein